MDEQSKNKLDDSLTRKLKSWQVTSALPPRFQQNVWNRIIAQDSPKRVLSFWQAIERWLAPAFLKPAVASAYLAALLAMGLATGYWQARGKTSEWENNLAAKYVQAIDPYQTPRR